MRRKNAPPNRPKRGAVATACAAAPVVGAAADARTPFRRRSLRGLASPLFDCVRTEPIPRQVSSPGLLSGHVADAFVHRLPDPVFLRRSMPSKSVRDQGTDA